MGYPFADIAFTPTVQALQQKYGSRAQYARMQARDGERATLDEHVRAYLAEADSFYLATVGETGWPYLQHRGGPRGFLKVLSPTQLAFADFRGNRQYVSAGNALGEDRAALIVMDYANRQRLKVLGHLAFTDVAAADPALVAAVTAAGYPARVERVATLVVEAIDWNCPQHITPRYTVEEVDSAARPLQARIAELEAQVRALGAAPR